ncbi:MAG: amidohydrolase family protein [Betaproteobacteria bacterium]
MNRWDTHAHVFAGAPRAGSHYTPPASTLAMWQACAAPHGIGRVVLVQPSVYGNDNSVMLDALRASGGVHRGVAVLDATVTDRELEAMHAAGVRGVRFNLVSPVGNDPAEIDAVAARIRQLGWHLQFFLQPKHYAWIRMGQALWRINVVLDHLAGLLADTLLSAGERADLQALGDAGACIKLSGFYRLGMQAPYAECASLIPHFAKWYSGRMLWGSDWPHTWYMESPRGAAPEFEQLLAPVRDAFADERVRNEILVEAPGRLYA